MSTLVDPSQVAANFLQTLVSYAVIWGPLVIALFSAWYVNSWLRDRAYHRGLDERRLRELYRPMEMMLKASLLALERNRNASPSEQEFIYDLFARYDQRMKDLVMKKSHLFLEPNLPDFLDQLLLSIDSYLLGYAEHKRDGDSDVFKYSKDFKFPDEANYYFASKATELARRLARANRIGRFVSRSRRFLFRLLRWPIVLRGRLSRST